MAIAIETLRKERRGLLLTSYKYCSTLQELKLCERALCNYKHNCLKICKLLHRTCLTCMRPRSLLLSNHQAMQNVYTILHTTHESPHNPPDSLQAVQCTAQQARSRVQYPTSLLCATHRWPCSSQQHRSQRPNVRTRATTNVADSRARVPPLRWNFFLVSRMQLGLAPAVCRRGSPRRGRGQCPCAEKIKFQPCWALSCERVNRTKSSKTKFNGQNREGGTPFLLPSNPPHHQHRCLPSWVHHVQYQE